MRNTILPLIKTIVLATVIQYSFGQGGSMRKVNLKEFDSVKVKEYEYLGGQKIIYKTTFTKNGLGIINNNNEEIYPPLLAYVGWCFDAKQFIVEDYATEKMGVLGLNGKWIIPAIYEEIKIPGSRNEFPLIPDANKVYFLEGKYRKWGAINFEGKEVLPFNYYGYFHFTEGYGSIGKGETYSGRTLDQMLVDQTGKILTAEVFENISYPDKLVDTTQEIMFTSERLFKVERKGKYGVINGNGKLTLPVIYDDIRKFDEYSGRTVVEKDGRYGVVDKQGKIVLPLNYVGLYMISGKVLGAKLGSNWGVISYDGNLINSTKYESIEDILLAEPGIAKFKRNGKFGVLNSDGKEIIPAAYSEIMGLVDRLIVLMVIDESGGMKAALSDYTGKMVLPLEYDGIGNLLMIKNYPPDAIGIARKKDELYWILSNRTTRKLTKAEIDKLQ